MVVFVQRLVCEVLGTQTPVETLDEAHGIKELMCKEILSTHPGGSAAGREWSSVKTQEDSLLSGGPGWEDTQDSDRGEARSRVQNEETNRQVRARLFSAKGAASVKSHQHSTRQVQLWHRKSSGMTRPWRTGDGTRTEGQSLGK